MERETEAQIGLLSEIVVNIKLEPLLIVKIMGLMTLYENDGDNDGYNNEEFEEYGTMNITKISS